MLVKVKSLKILLPLNFQIPDESLVDLQQLIQKYTLVEVWYGKVVIKDTFGTLLVS